MRIKNGPSEQPKKITFDTVVDKSGLTPDGLKQILQNTCPVGTIEETTDALRKIFEICNTHGEFIGGGIAGTDTETRLINADKYGLRKIHDEYKDMVDRGFS